MNLYKQSCSLLLSVFMKVTVSQLTGDVRLNTAPNPTEQAAPRWPLGQLIGSQRTGARPSGLRMNPAGAPVLFDSKFRKIN